MNTAEIIDGLHAYERKTLSALKDTSNFDEIVSKTGLKEVQVMRAVQWLQNKGLVTIKEELKELVIPDSNGKLYLRQRLPERRFLEAIKEGPLTVSALKSKIKLSDQEVEVCIGILRKKLAIEISKKPKGLEFSITGNGKEILESGSLEEQFLNRLPLEFLSMGREDRFCYDEMKKRSRIVKNEMVKTRTVLLTELGSEIAGYDLTKDNLETLTPEIIKSGSWQFKKFRRYDVKAPVPKIYYGRRHFVNETIDYIKRIWLDLGFKEMEGNLIQSSFWNFDALFTPQDHPARELQDTFFISNPDKAKLSDENLVKRVAKTHENGWTTGSKGWRYHWDPEEARKLVLRTHTTPLSAKTIASLKQEDLPAKFFAVGRCFRNETQDWSHLFEFYQVEGIIVDPNANFKNLIGYLKLFYRKMGYDKVKIRPGYFPYTEMSAEIDVYDKEHGKWMELGGAGIFRPEVVKPLLGRDIPVLAWGLGLSRIISQYYGLNDLRKLHSNDLKELREVRAWLK
ncbi:phenylalanine--tRNA ligase subunit alpha [Candidatus Woesearchaeota archaeon CG10_big_fil_rev_8_21_14_0_10_45_5]|nr:MAG: phenylalanine--tRNA ligase subunit alpha [Candidatus Woesearchaeota archaeon CG10_big_fil_rev_8_21_14_0_10_45_5]PIU29708.1 MAG: phenylalanine--tRNA ligase subunit alpha [Candidatus Woesearchaeota archaeon CG07_land_8_20_14_0_80_44_23]